MRQAGGTDWGYPPCRRCHFNSSSGRRPAQWGLGPAREHHGIWGEEPPRPRGDGRPPPSRRGVRGPIFRPLHRSVRLARVGASGGGTSRSRSPRGSAIPRESGHRTPQSVDAYRVVGHHNMVRNVCRGSELLVLKTGVGPRADTQISLGGRPSIAVSCRDRPCRTSELPSLDSPPDVASRKSCRVISKRGD
jgi:hypothetical protein